MKHVILSYDDDQQQTFFDLIEAPNSDLAQEIVSDVRDYASVIDSLTAQDLREMADQIDSGEVAPATRQAFAERIGAEYEPDEQEDTPVICECGREWEACATRDGDLDHTDR